MKKLWKKFISLKTVIFLSILIAVMGATAICGRVLIHAMASKNMEDYVITVKSQASMLASNLSISQYFTEQNTEATTEIANESSTDENIKQLADVYSARILVVDSDFNIVVDTAGVDEGRTIVAENIIKTFKGNPVTSTDFNTGKIEFSVPVYENSDGKNIVGVVALTLVYQEASKLMTYSNRVLGIILAAVAICTITIAILVSYFTTRPLEKLEKSIDGRGNVAKRSLYEYNRVAEAVNIAFSRLHTMDESKAQFVSNVSHELKTPMTSMKVLADSLVAQEDVPNEVYREFMEDIVGEIDRENKIINDLLDLVKLDRPDGGLNISATNINELAELVLKRLSPIANKAGVELLFESFRPFAAEVDEVKITQAVTNLVENAIKYNNPGGFVKLSVNADHRYFFITVKDNGIGIPKEAQDKIFDRFYRVDKARSRESGGTGLGLNITKEIVLLHKGEIKVSSENGEGSTFTIRIPLFHGKMGGSEK